MHILLFSVAFFLIPERKEKERGPFYARIVTPEELKGEGVPQPGIPKAREVPRRAPSPPTPPHRRQVRPVPEAPAKRPALRGIERPTQQIPKREPGKLPEAPAPQQTPLPGQAGGMPERPAPSPGTQPPAAPGIAGDQAPKQTRPPGSEGSGTQPKTAREKLFDKDVISKLTRPEKETAKPESGITFDTKEFKYYGYLQRLKEKIEGIWIYPQDAAERGINGDLYIRFTIKKNGRLGAVELVRTSGYRSLDEAAIKALRDAEPYWPLPDEWGKDGFTITGHFIYSLHGAYLR